MDLTLGKILPLILTQGTTMVSLLTNCILGIVSFGSNVKSITTDTNYGLVGW